MTQGFREGLDIGCPICGAFGGMEHEEICPKNPNHPQYPKKGRRRSGGFE